MRVDDDFEQGQLDELLEKWKQIDDLKISQPDEQSEIPPDTIEKQERELMKLMRGICENCNFYNLRPTVDGQIRDYVVLLTRLIDEYERAEASHGSQQ